MEHIRQLFLAGKLAQVFVALREADPPCLDGYQLDMCTVLESSYAQLEQQFTQRAIDTEDYQVQLSRMRSALLSLLNEVERQARTQNEKVKQIDLAQDLEAFTTLIRQRLAGRYSHIELIHNGDYAVVFRGQQNADTPFAQPVAIKVFKTISLVDTDNRSSMLQSFQRSKQLAERDGIVDILDEDLLTPPRYFVMPYIEGTSLEKYLDNGWMFTLREIKDILTKVTRALKDGHDDGIIHGNVRPSNLMLDRRTDPQLHPFQALELTLSHRSMERMLEVSRYWSPEQINTERISRRSDQYALGLLAFELFTGKPLFSGNTVLEIMASRLRFEENPALILDTQLKNTQCSIAFCQTLERMLSHQVEDRFPDLEDVMAAIENIKVERSMGPDFESVRRLKQSFDRCRRTPGFYQSFYQTLLEQKPALKEVFRKAFFPENAIAELPPVEDKVWRRQYGMLDMAMSRMFQYHDNPNLFQERLQALGRQHQGLGVAKEDFAFFLAVLKDTVARTDDRFWKDNLEGYERDWNLITSDLLRLLTNNPS
ncbi:MAG: protein kinase [Lewinellaceae bacterium]|nr:protein kinase [Lewinellaceae bacterium]